MKLPTSFWLASCLLATTLANQGLVGYGLDPTGTYCTWACWMPIGYLGLSCSVPNPATGFAFTSKSCRANDTAWLTTLANCFHTYCSDLKVSKLELAWETRVYRVFDLYGIPTTPDPLPKWTYQEALQQALTTSQPTRDLAPTDFTLNFTATIPHLTWYKQYNSANSVDREQIVGATYGIVILVVGFATPIILTWAGHLPFTSQLAHLIRLKSHLIYPSTIGTYSVRPLPYLQGNAPTRGQTLALAAFFILNVLLSTVNYRSYQPNNLRPILSFELTALVVYRTGIFAFALIPLMLLFSSRNNILLWWTNWPHSTYIMLHKWVARLFFVYSLVHTVVALPYFYKTDSKLPYWIWGAVAMVAMAIILLTSILWMRQKSYEVFLAVHIVLSVITLVGCWYHVYLWIGLGTYGYESWLYAACAVWFFDRLARAGRVVKNGIKRARVVELDGSGGVYVRIDVADVQWGTGSPGAHVYTYFPFLTSGGEWRQPWENHPFSLVPTVLLNQGVKGKVGGKKGGSHKSGSRSGLSSGHHHEGVEVDLEKNGVKPTVSTTPADTPASESGEKSSRSKLTLATAGGITFFIKKGAGVTKHLRAHNSLITLLDGPYSNFPTDEIRLCDKLLLVGGGIGITSLLPWISNHENVKICWSLRESARCLINELEGPLSRVQEKDVRVGSRLDFDSLLAQEVDAGWKKVGIVVSGPGGFCDAVRAAVVAAGKKGRTEFELEVDAYTW